MAISSAHVVSNINNEASGPSYSVVQLCRALNEDDCQTFLAVLGKQPEGPMPNFVRSFPVKSFPKRLGRSPEMNRWLRRAVESKDIDVVHNHGLWMMPNVYAGQATLGTNTPLVVSPRGTFSPWALNRSKWVKRAFWLARQSRAIKHAACFHATSEQEFLDIRRAGFQQPVCIIPNGVGIPESHFQPHTGKSKKTLLFLGRIHPVKGIDILLHAWSKISCQFADWELEIVGPDNEGYLKDMQELAKTLKLSNVYFRGPLFGEDKFRRYQEADLFVLPTRSENFGMTIAEALAAGTPVITTKNAPWSGLEERGAGWWIDLDIEALASCLEYALDCPSSQLESMGKSGREWMKVEYSWDNIARKTRDTYRWLLNGGDEPDWVKC